MKYIFLIFTTYLFSFLLQAQPNYTFTQYTLEDGLEQNTISKIIQDKRGFLWFASWDGLCRFDGYTFSNYKNTIETYEPSFISNRILNIKEDIYGCIWALGYDKRVSRFNRYTERLTPVLGRDSLVNNIFILPNGHVWLVTESHGILIASTNEDKTLQIDNFSKKANIPFDTKINRIIIDNNQIEWILTDSGIFKNGESKSNPNYNPINKERPYFDTQESDTHIYISSDKGEILKYNKKSGSSEIIKLPAKDRITVLKLIDKDLLFCGTSSDGFFLLSLSNGKIEHYNQSNTKGMPDNTVKDAYVDKYKEIWMKQDSPGVTHFNPWNKEVTHHTIKDKYGKVIALAHQVQLVVEDNQGNLYIHPNGGGFAYYDRAKKQLIPLYNKQFADSWQESDLILDVYKDRQENIWISSYKNGLEKITLKNRQFYQYPSSPFRDKQVDTRTVFIDKENRLWIGLKQKGVGVYDHNRQFLGYLCADGSLSLSQGDLSVMPYSITQDYKGTIWIGTKNTGVIAAFAGTKPNTFNLKHFKSDKNDIYSISDNDVWQIYEDNQQRLWFTTWNGGINYLEYDASGNPRFINYRNKLKNYPIRTSAKARSMVSDKKGNLWIATSNGLLVFNENFTDPTELKFNNLRHIPGDQNSLNNDDIQFVYCTSKQELYVATFGGGLNKLLSHNKQTTHFKSYTDKDGLLSNILLAMHEDPQGNLWISMIEGLSKFSVNTESFVNYFGKEISESIRFNDGAGCYSAKDSMMLFNTKEGVLSFSPQAIHKSTFVPSIAFTELQLGNYTVVPGDTTGILNINIDESRQLTFSHMQNSFSIHFASLDMINPHNILYSYRLIGFDDTWYQSERNHIANYTNLPKGDYIFEVRSTNSDGVWVDNIRRIPIHILPSFWESYWGISLYIIIGIVILSSILTYFRLKQKVRLEQKLTSLKLQFFTNISHELRTPLTLISGPVKSILANDNLQNDVRGKLKLVEKNTDRMNLLIDEILDFRKIQNHKMHLNIQSFDLITLVKHLMEFFAEAATAKGIDFTLESPISACTIWADTDKLEKILFNLIGNAFKYTPEGKQIKITINEIDEDILISVTDTGIGINDADQKRIFKPFETIASQQSRHQSGTGIGLSLVKELTEMHKATISLESKADKGSSFILRFRKGYEHFDESEIISYRDNDIYTSVKETDISYLSDIKIINEIPSDDKSEKGVLLIVEDNIELRYFLRTIFESEFDIIEAENGITGLEAARTKLPDIIISDIMMPEKDGIELLRDLRLSIDVSHIPIVLLTAKSSVENRIIGIELGADDYITKPFSPEYLKARIFNLLAQRKQLQQYYQSQLSSDQSMADIMSNTITNTITSNNQKFMNLLISSINKHINNGDLTIDDLAKETGMSRVVFFKKVKDLTGLSPIELLKDTRMKHAISMIRSSDLSISQIAFQVGFNDPHYFSKCFKLKYGITPTEYRDGKSPMVD